MTRRRMRLPACRVCGCTEDNACEGGCWWVTVEALSPPLCSACAGTEGDLIEAMRRIAKESWGTTPARIARAAMSRVDDRG